MMSTTTAPGVICLAVHRPNPALLRVQLDTIRHQTVADWRCIIGVDGPDPAAVHAIRSSTARDERFVVHEFAENVGFYRNFERLLGLVPGDAPWVALSDQDDAWSDTKLQTLIPHLTRVSLAAGQAHVTTAGGDARTANRTTRRRNTGLVGMLIDNQVTGSLSVFRRALLGRALPFPPATDVAYHDHWLAVCALVADGVRIVDRPVQDYVQHAGNVIGEAGHDAPSARWRRLATVAGAHRAMSALDYLSLHRWAWRVGMARQALRAGGTPPLRERDRVVLESFARGRCTVMLALRLIVAVATARAPFLRAGALLLGAWNAPRARARHRVRADPTARP